MNTINNKRLWLWFSLIALILITDRITKILVTQHLPYAEPISILPFFNLFFVYNTGAAFSFLSESGGWQNWLFSLIALSISVVLFVKLLKSNNTFASCAFALVIGGAFGNLYDRIVYQKVVDFADFYIKSWHWPAFNVADSAISIGVIMLLWLYCCKSTTTENVN